MEGLTSEIYFVLFFFSPALTPYQYLRDAMRRASGTGERRVRVLERGAGRGGKLVLLGPNASLSDLLLQCGRKLGLKALQGAALDLARLSASPAREKPKRNKKEKTKSETYLISSSPFPPSLSGRHV